MIHGGLELAERDAGECGVLAVGAEHPRVVRPAGTAEADAVDLAGRRRVLLALVHVPDLEVPRGLCRVDEVLLAPVDAGLQAPVTGQRELRPARGPLARTNLAHQGASRVVGCGSQLGSGLREALVGPGDGDP